MDTLPAKGIKDVLEARSKAFAAWSPAELIEYSVGNCHQPAKREISIIYDIAHVVAYRHADRHPQLVKLIETLFLSFDTLSRHLRMEEDSFFPIILRAAKKAGRPDSPGKPLPDYICEMAETTRKTHDAIANDLDILRELTGYYTIPGDGDFLIKYLFQKMKKLDREMLFHMHLENTVLFPKAIALARDLNRQDTCPSAFGNNVLSVPNHKRSFHPAKKENVNSPAMPKSFKYAKGTN